jgi:hypothetical protein
MSDRRLSKLATVVGQLHYPSADNTWIAQRLIDAVARGDSICFPNMFRCDDVLVGASQCLYCRSLLQPNATRCENCGAPKL